MHLFLGAACPPIVLGEPMEIDFPTLLFDFSLNLSGGEEREVAALRTYIDVLNVGRMWRGEGLDKRGNLGLAELELGEGLPEVVREALPSNDFGTVLRHYLAWASETSSGFLRDYFVFERELRLVVAAYRTKRRGGDVAAVLAGEEGDIAAELLAQKESAHFGMPYGFAGLEKTLARADEGPLEAYKALARYRFAWVEERTRAESFSLAWLLGYAVQMLIAEEWKEMEGRNGEEILKEKCG